MGFMSFTSRTVNCEADPTGKLAFVLIDRYHPDQTLEDYAVGIDHIALWSYEVFKVRAGATPTFTKLCPLCRLM